MGFIEYEQHSGIACITLNRPEKLNAFAESMREDLLAALRRSSGDPSVRAVLITGAGRGFCGGGDVRYMNQLHTNGDVEDFSRILDAANAAARTVAFHSKPVIAAVNGPAAGGGANLALACDIRLGATTCSFTQSFVKIGLGPDWGGSFILPSIVGIDRAKELLLTGRTVSADEALDLGLIHQLFDPSELLTAARSVAMKLAAASPHAVDAIKGALRLHYPRSLDAALEYERSAQLRCFLTQEAGEAFRAFSQPRVRV